MSVSTSLARLLLALVCAVSPRVAFSLQGTRRDPPVSETRARSRVEAVNVEDYAKFATIACGASELSFSPLSRFLAITTFQPGSILFGTAPSEGRLSVLELASEGTLKRAWDFGGSIQSAKYVGPATLLTMSTNFEPPRIFVLNRDGADWAEAESPTPYNSLRSRLGIWSVKASNLSIVDQNQQAPSNPNIAAAEAFIPTVLRERFRPTLRLEGLVSLTQTRDAFAAISSEFGGDLQVSVLSSSYKELGAIDTRVNRVNFPNLTIYRMPDQRLAIADVGLLAVFNGTSFIVQPLPLYSSPISDSGSEEIIAIHTPDKISFLKPTDMEISINSELRKWLDSGWYLQNVAIDRESSRIALLLRGAGDQDYAIVLFGNSGSGVIRCNQSGERQNRLNNQFAPYRNAPVRHPEFSIKFHQVEGAEQALGIWTIEPNIRSRGDVIWVRGGPAQSVRGNSLSDLERFILKQGYTIHRIEYSGAIQSSPEMSFRLRRSLRQSLTQDANTVLNFLATRKLNSSTPRRPTLIIANSFGTTLAGQMVAQGENLVDGVILFAPLSHWTPPSIPIDPTQAIPSVFVQRLEHITFGAPIPNLRNQEEVEAFSQVIDGLIDPLCHSRNTKVIVGKFDERTPAESWNRDCRSQIPKAVIEDAGHALSPQMEVELRKSFLRAVDISRRNISNGSNSP